MGMDFVAIVDNNFSKAEILDLPNRIDESSILKKLFSARHQKSIDYKPEYFKRRTDWSEKGNREMNETNLERIWNHLKNDTEIENIEHLCFDTTLDAYFGWMNIYEKSITITLSPEHKYGNLRNPITSKYVFGFIREIAKLFKANRIIYCCDSYFTPSILEEKSMMGWRVEDIIAYGNEIFGEPPKELNAAIENLYFIDEFDLNLDELNPDKEVWSRAKYEYDKEQKGEPPYNKL